MLKRESFEIRVVTEKKEKKMLKAKVTKPIIPIIAFNMEPKIYKNVHH